MAELHCDRSFLQERPIDIGADAGDFGFLEEDWGDGEDLAAFRDDEALKMWFAGGSDESSDEEVFEDGGGESKFAGELGQSRPSIVPDGITKIRVVTLKYQDQVIAFRFKTNVGAFDMKKSVAAGYGLGGFKTETYITLQSVNGVLMSDSERRRQVCVPDVSDCREDCDKLMEALFNF